MSAPDRHDIVEAAGSYIWSSVDLGYLVPVNDAIQWSGPTDDRQTLVTEVETLLAAYRAGGRLTPHRSGDAYEPLRDKFTNLKPLR